MSEHIRRGRHRSATRYSPVAELSTIARSVGESGARASAVLAASGGLAAAFALPANAAAVGSTTTASSASVHETSAAPAADTARTATTTRTAAAAPAVVAPSVAAPIAAQSVGVTGVKAVAKPKPKPKPEPVVQEAIAQRDTSSVASRSEAPAPAPAPAPAAPAPAPEPPAPTNVAQSSSGVVNIARGLLGIPYVYGGSSPSGFDCSGFTMYVFGKAGISLPRTAADQQAAATPVSDPQPGDLVFFGSPAWHVGIYTGNGMMIDSGKPGEVTTERAIFSGVSGYGRF